MHSITKKRIDEFHQKTDAFSFAQKQSFVTFLEFLRKEEIEVDYAVACIRKRQQLIEQQNAKINRSKKEWNDKALKCPECGKAMYISPVNTGPADQVGGKFKSVWYCLDAMGCGYEQYSKKSWQQWFQKLRIKIPKSRVR